MSYFISALRNKDQEHQTWLCGRDTYYAIMIYKCILCFYTFILCFCKRLCIIWVFLLVKTQYQVQVLRLNTMSTNNTTKETKRQSLSNTYYTNIFCEKEIILFYATCKLFIITSAWLVVMKMFFGGKNTSIIWPKVHLHTKTVQKLACVSSYMCVCVAFVCTFSWSDLTCIATQNDNILPPY